MSGRSLHTSVQQVIDTQGEVTYSQAGRKLLRASSLTSQSHAIAISVRDLHLLSQEVRLANHRPVP
jgi:hypothetical protein